MLGEYIDRENKRAPSFEFMQSNNGIIEVEGIGFGSMLIKSDVMATIDYPQFLYMHSIDFKNTLSEDMYFCEKAKQAGYKIYANLDVKCEHIASAKLSITNY